MKEVVFKSTLPMDEIEKNFEDMDFFSGLMEGLTEALSYTQGKAAAETYSRKRSLPQVDIVELRKSLEMTQKGFADILGVSCRTVEAWEAGKTNPTPTAKKLIYLIHEDHSLVRKLAEA